MTHQNYVGAQYNQSVDTVSAYDIATEPAYSRSRDSSRIAGSVRRVAVGRHEADGDDWGVGVVAR